MPLERGEIVQVADNRRIVFGAGAIARADTPGECAQLVGRRLDRIDAQE